jgi:hypothetical protein
MFFRAELLNDPRRRGSTTNVNEEGEGRSECDDRLDMVCGHLVICLFFEARLPVSADTPSLSFALLGMPLCHRMFCMAFASVSQPSLHCTLQILCGRLSDDNGNALKSTF